MAPAGQSRSLLPRKTVKLYLLSWLFIDLILVSIALSPALAVSRSNWPAFGQLVNTKEGNEDLSNSATQHPNDDCCEGRPDGLHPDLSAQPFCSAYCECVGQRLLRRTICPPTLLFDAASAGCNLPHLATCGAAPQAALHHQEGELGEDSFEEEVDEEESAPGELESADMGGGASVGPQSGVEFQSHLFHQLQQQGESQDHEEGMESEPLNEVEDTDEESEPDSEVEETEDEGQWDEDLDEEGNEEEGEDVEEYRRDLRGDPTKGRHPPGVGKRPPGRGRHPPGVGKRRPRGRHPPGVGRRPPGTGRHPPGVGGRSSKRPPPPRRGGRHPPGTGKHPPGVGKRRPRGGHPPGAGRRPPGTGRRPPGKGGHFPRGRHPPGVGRRPPGEGGHPPGVGKHFDPCYKPGRHPPGVGKHKNRPPRFRVPTPPGVPVNCTFPTRAPRPPRLPPPPALAPPPPPLPYYNIFTWSLPSLPQALDDGCCIGKSAGNYASLNTFPLCSYYCTCNATGFVTAQFCPEGLLFDEESQECDWAPFVQCGNTTFNAPPPPDLTTPVRTTGFLDRNAVNCTDRCTPLDYIKRNKFFRYSSVASSSLPGSVCWMEFIPAVKNQRACAACWAFAPVAAMEAAIAINDGTSPRELSLQQVLDCMVKYGNTCEGGDFDDALEYTARLGGLTYAAEYPLAEGSEVTSGTCDTVKEAAPLDPTASRVVAWERVAAKNVTALMQAVAAQPVVVAISTAASSFYTYTGGIYSPADDECTENPDHAVVVVGYGATETGREYWLILNSWGPSWGEDGYMKIEKLANGPGACNMLVIPPAFPVMGPRFIQNAQPPPPVPNPPPPSPLLPSPPPPVVPSPAPTPLTPPPGEAPAPTPGPTPAPPPGPPGPPPPSEVPAPAPSPLSPAPAPTPGPPGPPPPFEVPAPAPSPLSPAPAPTSGPPGPPPPFEVPAPAPSPLSGSPPVKTPAPSPGPKLAPTSGPPAPPPLESPAPSPSSTSAPAPLQEVVPLTVPSAMTSPLAPPTDPSAIPPPPSPSPSPPTTIPPRPLQRRVLIDGVEGACGGINFNMCGGGTCIPDANLMNYTCLCPEGFVSVPNTADGNEACVPADPCFSTTFNPCGVGSCTNDGRGGYSCDCPQGFVEYQRSEDDSLTCGPADVGATSAVNNTYVVPAGGQLCTTIASTNGITPIQLLFLNPYLNCGQGFEPAIVPEDSQLAVGPIANQVSCGVIYSTVSTDTCRSLSQLFTDDAYELTPEALERLNADRGVDCSDLDTPIGANVALCVQDASSVLVQPCGQFYTVQPGDSNCTFLYEGVTTPLSFFSLNPGLNCGNLVPGEEICVAPYQPFGSTLRGNGCPVTSCSARNIARKLARRYTLRRGDTCASVAASGVFRCNINIWNCLNGGAVCNNRRILRNTVVCAPGRAYVGRNKCPQVVNRFAQGIFN